MAFSTRPAFVHCGTWNDETRKHEAMDWMEKYTKKVDDKVWDKEPSSNWLTSDSVMHKSTGEVVSGGDAVFKSLSKEVYSPFAEHLHDPQFLVCWEIDGGWEMLGVATLYWNLQVPGDGGAKVKDSQGKQWDGAGPAAFDFHYKKTADGIRLAKTAIYTDPSVAIVSMLKRGMMKPEDLVK